MSRIVLHPEVADDLRALMDYFEAESNEVADRFADAVFPTLQDLARMSGKGSLKFFRSRLLANIRSWPIRGFRRYLIYYQTIPKGIRVVAIVHGSRKLRKLLMDRLKP